MIVATGLLRYTLSSLSRVVLVSLAALVLNFVIFRMMPGDPAALLLRGAASSGSVVGQAELNSLRAQMGFDKPLPEQFVIYLVNVFQGNLGYSFVYRQNVGPLVAGRLVNSVVLLSLGASLATVFGVLLAVASTWNYGTAIDKAIQLAAYAFYAMPIFWLGMICLVISVQYLHLPLPVSGMQTSGAIETPMGAIEDILLHLTIPTIVLVLGYVGQYAFIMRNLMLDVSTEDYVVTARSKGLTKRNIMFGTVLRNAMPPLVTMIMLNFGFFLAGSLTTEIVFSWPGLGLLIYDSVTQREYIVLQACFLVICVCVAVFNLIADLLCGLLDPRVRAT